MAVIFPNLLGFWDSDLVLYIVYPWYHVVVLFVLVLYKGPRIRLIINYEFLWWYNFLRWKQKINFSSEFDLAFVSSDSKCSFSRFFHPFDRILSSFLSFERFFNSHGTGLIINAKLCRDEFNEITKVSESLSSRAFLVLSIIPEYSHTP